jgi:hypothetical protein
MNKKILDAVAKWKYKPGPLDVGVIETEMTVIIDLLATMGKSG